MGKKYIKIHLFHVSWKPQYQGKKGKIDQDQYITTNNNDNNNNIDVINNSEITVFGFSTVEMKNVGFKLTSHMIRGNECKVFKHIACSVN